MEKMIRRAAILAMIPVLLGLGCATRSDIQGIERKTAMINEDMRAMKGGMDEVNYSLQAEVKRGKEAQAKLAEVQKSNAQIAETLKAVADDLSVIKRNQADLGSRMHAMAGGEISSLGGQMEELNHDVASTNMKLDALKALLMQKLSAREAEAQPAVPPTGQEKGQEAAKPPKQEEPKPTTDAPPPVSDPMQLYQAAYLDYTKGNYDLALDGFREYLKDFPDAEFAGNAQYWIGEALYSQNKYEDAVTEFDKVVTGFPDSPKAPGALLKKAYCLEALGMDSDAKAALDALAKKYPSSEAAKLAKERKKKKLQGK